MYLVAPINKIYKPKIDISEGKLEIIIDIHEGYFHADGAVHFHAKATASFFYRL